MDRNSNMVLWYIDWAVALRKESVDRNATVNTVISCIMVALRKESVDRNMWWGVRKAVGSRRSPQGERG